MRNWHLRRFLSGPGGDGGVGGGESDLINDFSFGL